MHVAIIVPAYKRPKLLGLTLASIEKSTHKNLSAIVIYEKEDKVIHDMLYGLVGQISFPLILSFNPKDRGVNSAMNHGFRIASYADAIIYAGDDIEFRADSIAMAVNALKEKFPDGDGLIALKQQQKRSGAAVGLVGKKFTERFPNKELFCPDYIHYYPDLELWLYAIATERHFQCIEAVLVHHRLQDEAYNHSNQSREHDVTMNRERKKRGYLWGKTFDLVGDL